jgi:hypothetical protein
MEEVVAEVALVLVVILAFQVRAEQVVAALDLEVLQLLEIPVHLILVEVAVAVADPATTLKI